MSSWGDGYGPPGQEGPEDDESMPPLHDALENWKYWFQRRLSILVYLVVVLWLITIVDVIFGQPVFSFFGIQPRHPLGLIGLFTAPFVHSGVGHVAANTVPLFVLGGLILLPEFRARDTKSSHSHALKIFFVLSLWISVAGGLLTWTLGSGDSVHGGASGLVFGYFGYLVALGVVEQHWKSLLVAATVGILYGGMLWGIFPADERQSWEGHMFGLLAGVVAALAHGYLPFIRLWFQGYLSDEAAAAETVAHTRHTAERTGLLASREEEIDNEYRASAVPAGYGNEGEGEGGTVLQV